MCIVALLGADLTYNTHIIPLTNYLSHKSQLQLNLEITTDVTH